MTPGPSKQFDVEGALEQARDIFWARGYDGTAVSELETALGVGRKSLYDTFGCKRQLFLRALEQYTDTVIEKICRGLADERNAPIDNLERVLMRLQQHHGTPGSRGCLLGVAMAQAGSEDEELAEQLRGYLKRLEEAFTRTIERAQELGAIDPGARPRDCARNLVALTQGMALLGRIGCGAATTRAAVRAALRGLRAGL